MRFSPARSVRILAFALALGALLAPLRGQNDAASRREAIEMMYPVMINALETKNYSRARKICDQVIVWEPQNPVHHYNLACIEAQAGGPRIPYAFGALELAVALGFEDVDHLKSDPDLVPLHTDPKFAEIIRKAMHNATADSAISSLVIPESVPKPRAADTAPAGFEKPAPAAFRDGVPVGLYYMTRYRSDTRAVEKTAWYFAPDGTTYRNLAAGFSQSDLATHVGAKGQASSTGSTLKITWSDGSRNEAPVEREGAGFTWDEGIFTSVSAFEGDDDLAGSYETSDPIGGRSGPSRRLQLNADGTYVFSGATVSRTTTDPAELQLSEGESTGRWKLSGYSLSLTGESSARFRGLVFPVDDPATVVRPDWLFFGGIMFKRRP